jgi:hypothetical protein
MRALASSYTPPTKSPMNPLYASAVLVVGGRMLVR